MRYQNWDVLLFPAGSKVPIQEFKTAGHVIRDPDKATAFPRPYGDQSGALDAGLLPVLTTFVTSLKASDPFRVSVHSWARPQPSLRLVGCMSADDSVMFEARVYLDGVRVASHIFDNRTVWPVVIDRDIRFDTEGHAEPLRFPPFHHAILQQSHWDAGESFGRIKVVISEGVARSYSSDVPQSGGFERFRDSLIFSFQHAPANILEYSNISWPSEQMFRIARAAFCRGPQPHAGGPGDMTGYEAHSHSPRRASQPFGMPFNTPFASQMGPPTSMHAAAYFPQVVAPQPERHTLHHSKWAIAGLDQPQQTPGVGDDPFLDPSHISATVKSTRDAGQRSTSHDVSMPDYVSSKSSQSRVYTEMSDVAYNRNDFEKSMKEAAIEEIIKALTPIRKAQLRKALNPGEKDASGTDPPNNTPASVPATETTTGLANAVANSTASTRHAILQVVNPTLDQSRSTSAMSSKLDQPEYSATRSSNSPASSIQGRRERWSLNGRAENLSTQSTPANEEVIEVKSKMPSLDQYVDEAEEARRRSTSNVSKRKRSLSTRQQEISGMTSPVRMASNPPNVTNPFCSPVRANEASPHHSGVVIGA